MGSLVIHQLGVVREGEALEVSPAAHGVEAIPIELIGAQHHVKPRLQRP